MCDYVNCCCTFVYEFAFLMTFFLCIPLFTYFVLLCIEEQERDGDGDSDDNHDDGDDDDDGEGRRHLFCLSFL